MLTWIKHRSGLSTRGRKKYGHSRTDSSGSDTSTCTTSSVDSRASTVRTTITAGTDPEIFSEHPFNSDHRKNSWEYDSKTRSCSRSPSFSSFKTSDSLLSFDCLGDEAIAIATTATITRCKANTSVRIVERPPLRKAKSIFTFDIDNDVRTPGTTPERAKQVAFGGRLNSWEQAKPRDGLCPIGPFAPHGAHTCHYLHLPVPPPVGATQ